MTDNFLLFLKEELGQQLIVSGILGDILIWGNRENSNIRLIGLSYNEQIKEKKTSENNSIIGLIQEIAIKIAVPFIHIEYPESKIINDSSLMKLNNIDFLASDVPQFIQEHFGTNQEDFGTNKPVNKSISDQFQYWARNNLPSNYVRIDIDGLFLDSLKKPLICLEVKRSPSQSISVWKPYINDIRNYYLELLFCEKLQIKFVTIHHTQLSNLVKSTTEIGIHKINNVDIINKKIDAKFTPSTAGKMVDYLRIADKQIV